MMYVKYSLPLSGNHLLHIEICWDQLYLLKFEVGTPERKVLMFVVLKEEFD